MAATKISGKPSRWDSITTWSSPSTWTHCTVLSRSMGRTIRTCRGPFTEGYWPAYSIDAAQCSQQGVLAHRASTRMTASVEEFRAGDRKHRRPRAPRRHEFAAHHRAPLVRSNPRDADAVRVQCDIRVKRCHLKQSVEEHANIWKRLERAVQSCTAKPSRLCSPLRCAMRPRSLSSRWKYRARAAGLETV
jgi:hypothetical protein